MFSTNFMSTKASQMKALTITSVTLLLLVCCKKQPVEMQDDWLQFQHVKTLLKDSMSTDDFSDLDFSRVVKGKLENEQAIYLRIPLNTNKYSEFVLIQMDTENKVSRSRIITIEKAPASQSTLSSTFNGTLLISSLSRTVLSKHKVADWFIQEIIDRPFSQRSGSTLVVPSPIQGTPPVVTSTETSGAMGLLG